MVAGVAGSGGGRGGEDLSALCRSGEWSGLLVSRLRERRGDVAQLVDGRDLALSVECGGIAHRETRIVVSGGGFVSLVSPTNLLATDFVADVTVRGEPEEVVVAVLEEGFERVGEFDSRLSAEDRAAAVRFLRFAVETLAEL